MINKVLVLGNKGTLGQVLAEEFTSAGYPVTGWDKAEIDVTSPGLETEIQKLSPDLILNCVAHTAVDLAETDPGQHRLAVILNSRVPGDLARISRSLNALFVHFSTDFVFKGDNPRGYIESDLPQPQNVYGQTKYAGEQAVTAAGGKYYIVRLSRLFGAGGESSLSKRTFIDVMLSQVGRQVIKVKNEESSCLTYTWDLADLTRELVESGQPYGIYHGANSGACTPYQWALEIFRDLNLHPDLQPVPASEFPSPATRPLFSELLNTKLNQQRSWQAALSACLNRYYKK